MRRLFVSIYIALALFVVGLLVTSDGWSHPGIGGCKAVDEGGIEYSASCAATIEGFRQKLIQNRNGNLSTWALNTCWVQVGAPTTVTAATASGFAECGIPFDQQVRVRTLTCAYAKIAAFDASDTLTVKLHTITSAGATSVLGSGFTINQASASADVLEEVIDANTSPTSNYVLALVTTAVDDTTAGSELLSMTCSFSYEYL